MLNTINKCRGALSARQEVEIALKMLNRQSDPHKLLCRIVASKIVGALKCSSLKSEDWLAMILAEPRLDLEALHKRISALAGVSTIIQNDLGDLPDRLGCLLEEGVA